MIGYPSRVPHKRSGPRERPIRPHLDNSCHIDGEEIAYDFHSLTDRVERDIACLPVARLERLYPELIFTPVAAEPRASTCAVKARGASGGWVTANWRVK